MKPIWNRTTAVKSDRILFHLLVIKTNGGSFWFPPTWVNQHTCLSKPIMSNAAYQHTLNGIWVGTSIPQLNTKHATGSYDGPVWGKENTFSRDRKHCGPWDLLYIDVCGLVLFVLAPVAVWLSTSSACTISWVTQLIGTAGSDKVMLMWPSIVIVLFFAGNLIEPGPHSFLIPTPCWWCHHHHQQSTPPLPSLLAPGCLPGQPWTPCPCPPSCLGN